MKNKYKIDGIADSLFGPWHPWSPLGRAIPLYWLMVPVPLLLPESAGRGCSAEPGEGPPCPQLTSRACARHGRAISCCCDSSCLQCQCELSEITLFGLINIFLVTKVMHYVSFSLCCQTPVGSFFSVHHVRSGALTLSGPFTPKAPVIRNEADFYFFHIDCIFEKLLIS